MSNSQCRLENSLYSWSLVGILNGFISVLPASSDAFAERHLPYGLVPDNFPLLGSELAGLANTSSQHPASSNQKEFLRPEGVNPPTT